MLKSNSLPFPIITCFPRIWLKVFSVLNFWIFSLFTCFFRAYLFLVMDTANPQSMLPGQTRNPQRETENSKSVQAALAAPLPAECSAESGLGDTLRVGTFCILAEICHCLALCVFQSLSFRGQVGIWDDAETFSAVIPMSPQHSEFLQLLVVMPV